MKESSKNEMVSKFMCPGCTCGSSPSTKCNSFKLETHKDGGETFFDCSSHSAGTFMLGAGRILLGLPKGFNRAGPVDTTLQKTMIRLWDGNKPNWDHLNVPVWAMEEDGDLFVRTMCPRINVSFVDVIRGGTLAMCPQAIDVSKFIDEID